MNRPLLSLQLSSCFCLVAIAAVALCCSGSDSGASSGAIDVVRIPADLCKREVGSMMELPAASFTPWYGRSASGADAPDVLGDLRPSLVCDLPARFSFAQQEQELATRLTTAVRRFRPGKGDAIRAEVFWRQGEQLQSLIAVEIAGEDESWHELQVDVPSGAGELVFFHRFAAAGLAEKPGEPVAWSQPILAPTARPQQPDVILLTIDTLRADAIKHSPFLEQLMNSGKRWQRAYSPSNWTLPSYASLMTGLQPEDHGCGRGPFAEEPTEEVEDRSFRTLGSAHTIAEAMRDAGFATCLLHQNPLLESWTGLDRGYERYVRTADRAAANRESALSWWQANQHRPRFLTLHYMAPHLPYAPATGAEVPSAANPLDSMKPEELFERDHSSYERQQYFDLSNEDRELVKAWYQADVAAMDDELRRLITKLQESSPDCMILIHSDHGEELWDAGSFEHGHSFDDSVILVPLAMVRAGVIEPESISTPVPAHHLGTYMLEVLGVPNRLPASALGESANADRTVISSYPLYRSPIGGLELLEDGTWLELPPSLEGSSGDPGVIDPETAARMAALGYSGE